MVKSIKSAIDSTECAECMKKCDLKETIWKIMHEGKIYCFCSEKCKNKFQEEKFGEILY